MSHRTSYGTPRSASSASLLTSVPYFDAKQISAQNEPKTHVLSVHFDSIKVQTLIPHPSPPDTDSKRGNVKGFSKKSRKRMIEFLSTARNRPDEFLTLTYADENLKFDKNVWNAHFEAFRRRFERQFPTYSAIWRQEIKPRKSGIHIGREVPHFHLLIYRNGESPENRDEATLRAKLLETWASLAWFEITGSQTDKHKRHGAHCAPIHSMRHLYSYASKYVAKEDNDEMEIGRRWGRIGQFDTSESVEVSLTFREEIEFRRLVSQWLKRKSRHYARTLKRGDQRKSFTILGLGDHARENPLPDDCHEILRLIQHAKELAKLRERKSN